jgi:putative FmdB family regulatory protein
MPVYEFRCNECNHRFSEFYRSMSRAAEGPTPCCPQCHCTATTRMISAFALHGPAQTDARETAAAGASAAKEAQVTPKTQLDQWRGAKK